MKYINGREAKIGDTIAHKGLDGKPELGVLVGVLVGIGEDAPNGTMVPHPINARQIDLGNCLHIDDLSGNPKPLSAPPQVPQTGSEATNPPAA